MIRNYFRIAWRNIQKNKLFSAINIIGLALSLACCLAIALYVYTELSHDRFHKNKDSIYRITERQNQAGEFYNTAMTPGPLSDALKKDFPEIVNTIRFGNWSGILKNGMNTFEEPEILYAENSLFSMFNFKVILGNPSKALNNPDDIVITESIANKFFGKDWRSSTAILGQTFQLNKKDNFRLVAVVEDVPEFSSIEFKVLLPIQHLFNTDEWAYRWGSNNFHTYIQIKPGTDFAAFGKKIKSQLIKYNPKTEDLLFLQPLSQQYLYSDFAFNTDWGKRSDIKYIKIFSWVGILLLIITCVNFINLSTARAIKRSLEVGVRKVTGASRPQLIFQFLTESIVLSVLAGAFGMIILQMLRPFIKELTGVSIDAGLNSWFILPLFIVITVVLGAIAGLYPALVLSAFNPIKVFRNSISKLSGKGFRKVLVVLQFVISIALITTTFFMYRQLKYVQQRDLGFDKEQLLTIRLGGELRNKSSLYKKEIDELSFVQASSAATVTLINVDNSGSLEWEGMQPGDNFLITQANIDPSFLPTLKIQLMSGTNFSTQKTNDTTNYILNESAVKRMGYTLQSAIGKSVNFWGAKGHVIGVVKDFNYKPLKAVIDPFIFRYQPEDRYFNLLVKTVPGKTEEAILQMEKIYKKYEADYPFQFSFVNEEINRLYLEDRRSMNIIFLFACLTIFVGCLGLFGLTVFATETRIKEIGIRKVLGANMGSLIKLLSKDFIKLVIFASVLAVPVAWIATNKWLQDYVYRIKLDWWIFLITAVLTITVAFLTVCIHAMKVATGNPSESLRAE